MMKALGCLFVKIHFEGDAHSEGNWGSNIDLG